LDPSPLILEEKREKEKDKKGKKVKNNCGEKRKYITK